ncbi:hypothetical protein BDB00DRAFT_869033 [Zychaea mexicana]|uniref:uncharacterized protein n=1 Tax=Zychaea mexicana TaxID=64656 RepID=UPI0022FE915D|nr:uncharacterized protein BDB00DRAFT_869033 [Zychaea mexicana]KAI9496808.1 hypothetical protein BDB00DRAFT_869033 [Zychaea mexicana]
MFLDWIAQLRLLQHDPQTNILGSLPLSIRRALISEITNYLQPIPGKHVPDPSIFASPAHVKWFMEVLGQGFSLPLEDMEITSNDVSIYAQWLFEPHMRPSAVVSEGLEQEFYQIIFHQYSLLFQPRITQTPSAAAAAATTTAAATSSSSNHRSNSTINYNPQQHQHQSSSQQQHSQQNQHQQQQHPPHNQTHQQHHSNNGSSSSSSNIHAHGSSSGRPNSFYLNMMPINPHANLVPVTLPSPTNAASPHIGSGAPSAAAANASAASALKETLSQMVHRHIELCKKTLTVLAMAGRTLEMTAETWTVLLKVVLGISDSLLKEPVADATISGVANMGDELCEHLLRVLFELWLRSRIREVEMWDILKDCFMRWSHRPKVIQHWSSTSLSLTNRVLNLLYGSDEGTDVVILSANGIIVKLDLSPEFVYYSWHRILYLAPHPLHLPPSNFTLMMLGIGHLVDLFNKVGERHVSVAATSIDDNNNSNTPDGNTILHIFGTWLFDASSTAPSADVNSQRGCAAAFASLCKVFCRPQRSTPFLRTYIERFYAALCVGLKSDACLPTILLHCTELFATDLDGVRMLAPEFIAAIKMVLPKLQIDCKGFVGVDDLRLAAIKVVSTIMCLPNHFDKVELKPGWDWDMQCASDNASVLGEQEQIVTQLIRVLYADQHHGSVERPFTGLKFYILELLLMSLRTETSSYNMRYLLHLINVYVIEDVPFCPGLVGTVVKLIEEKILTMQMPSDVTLVAFDVLIDFVDLYDYNVARELVLALSRYVDALINAGKLIHSYPLIVQAYDCMIKWILVSQWIMDDQDCYKAVIATLSKGITIFDRETDTTNTVESQHPEKKKRRDTTFPPTKQLFQLPPRANKPTTTSSNTASNPLQQSSSGSGGRSNSTVYKKEEVAVRMAAEYCMSQFVNQLGKFPMWNEQRFSNRKAMIMSDLQQVKYRRWKQHQQGKTDNKSNTTINDSNNSTWESRDSIRYFLFDKRMILAVYDVESTFGPKETPAVVAIIRDTTGKYVWSVETRYKDPRKVANGSPTTASPTTSPSGTTSPPALLENNGDSPLTDGSGPTITGNNNSNNARRQQQQQQQQNNNVLQVPVAQAVNEDAIPNIDNLFDKSSDNWKQWASIQSLAEREQSAETAAVEKSKKKPLDRYSALPTGENINTDSARGFRLLLSELGLLLPQNRAHITPLRITDTLITEIETLDMLNERDCISVTAYYAQSGNTSWSELVESPAAISEQFLQYLNCLGWPVEIAEHQGFRGKLDPAICDTMPYYADRTIEFLVNVPYLLKTPPADNGVWGTTQTLSKIHQQVSSDDHVCIVWIEDLTNYTELARRIKMSSSNNAKSMVFIFINPLKNSGNGLYWIRILIPSIGNNATSVMASQRLNENALIFGPLVDGIIVSRHALGAMVRNTAISAHQACRVVTETYTRPYVMRKQFIEEMAHRHRSKQQFSEFYSEVFIGKDN